MDYHKSSDWPDEHAEALKQHHACGLSFSQISARILSDFDAFYSRNACIGKAARLGLSQPRKKSVLRAKSNAIGHRLARRAERPQQFTCELATGLRIADVVPLHLNLLDLEPDQCRWPYGDGPYTFCGCHAFDGGPYCEPHAALSQGLGSRGEQMAAHGLQRVA